MLHACVQKFDVTGNLEKFGILGATNKGLRGRLKAVRNNNYKTLDDKRLCRVKI